MTFRSFLMFAFPVAALAYATGCQPKQSVDSGDVATHAMSMNVIANASGTNTTIEAELHVGDYKSATLTKLTPGDQLILMIPGDPNRAMQEKDGGTYRGIYYSMDVSKTSGDFTIDFTRTKGASALGNKLSLPAPFTLVPIAGPISRKEPLTVKWDRADGSHQMSIWLESSCINSASPRTITGDPGTFTFNAGDIQSAPGSETANCSVVVKLSRTLDFSNSTFSAEFGQQSHARTTQLRSLAVDTKP
jgi:hypothetical protein